MISEWIFVTVMVLQLFLLAWVIFGNRVEVKRLTSELVNIQFAAHNVTQPEFAPEITVQNPDTGMDFTFQHQGNGLYGPPAHITSNNVEEVEGSM